MKKLLIWGAGDQGIVTLDCALAMKTYDKIDFLNLNEKTPRNIQGYQIYEESGEPLCDFLKGYDEVIVATGSNDLREKKISVLNSIGIALATIIHPTAVISPSASVLGGSTVLALAVLNPNAMVGFGCIVNTGAIIEHDCVVGDFTNICPRVSLAGHTRLGRKTYLGIGCTIIDDIEVGMETTIGAGAAVIRDVPDYATAVGVPAKVIRISKPAGE